MRKILLLVALILTLSVSVSAIIQTDTITTSGPYVVPAGVFSISIHMIGGGGSGGSGGDYYTVDCISHLLLNSMTWQGSGGLAGQERQFTNIAVTPNQVLQITVGSGGASMPGLLYEAPLVSGPNIDFPAASSHAYDGGSTTINISGTTYEAKGGSVGNITVNSPGCGGFPAEVSRNYYGSTGQAGIGPITYFASYGSNGPDPSMPLYIGGAPGAGYGAGGGGGGEGSFNTNSAGGAGGAGAQGAVMITYNTASTDVFINGYVLDSTATPVIGANISVVQGGITYNQQSSSGGYYTFPSAFSIGFGINMTTNAPGYVPSSFTFIPQTPITIQINQTLVIPPISTNKVRIGSVIRSAPYYQPAFGATLFVTNSTTTEFHTNISNIAGFALADDLVPNQNYLCWASLSTANSTPVNVTAAAS